jgi:hypothetical protein
MSCHCQDQSSSSRDRQNVFAERAMKLAMALPDAVTCNKTYLESEAGFLNALRDLASGYALAHTWSESEARTRFEALKFADAAFSYASQLAPGGGGGGGGESCTARCNREKNQCTQSCNDSDGSYWCFFDCRLTYMACLAGCITGGGKGGVVIA